MSSNWLYVDTNFPVFTDGQTAEEQMRHMQTYLFMLVEQLRYSLNNLDESNMNDAAWQSYRNTLLTQFNGQIADMQESIRTAQEQTRQIAQEQAKLRESVGGFDERIAGMQDELDQLEDTVNELEERLTALEELVAGLSVSLEQTENKTVLRVTSGEAVLSETAMPDYATQDALDELRQAQAALEDRVRALETENG